MLGQTGNAFWPAAPFFPENEEPEGRQMSNELLMVPNQLVITSKRSLVVVLEAEEEHESEQTEIEHLNKNTIEERQWREKSSPAGPRFGLPDSRPIGASSLPTAQLLRPAQRSPLVS